MVRRIFPNKKKQISEQDKKRDLPKSGADDHNQNPEPESTPAATILAPKRVKVEPKRVTEKGIVIQHEMSGDILLWTKVLVKNETGWAILLEFKPDVKRTLGTTIRFVRAEHKGKDVVTNSITTTEPSGFEEFFDTLEQIDKIHSVYISQICLEMKTEEATPSKIGDLINFNPNSWDNILERYFKDKTILGVDSSRIYYV